MYYLLFRPALLAARIGLSSAYSHFFCRFLYMAACAGMLVCFLLVQPVHAQSAPLMQAQQNRLSSMLKAVMPAVVNLSIQGHLSPLHPPGTLPHLPHAPGRAPLPPGLGRRAPQPMPYRFHSAGSGVIIDAKKGYIITNAHVVKNADIITVSLNDGRHLIGKKIGEDIPSDLALIHIPATHLKSIPFGDTSAVQVGNFVAAIGNPFGLHQTVTSGVVSALHRDTPLEEYSNFIQTDASINPGNSGGALVNMRGELIGINTAIISASGGNMGIGFAIPSNTVKRVLKQLVQYGKVERGWLGVSLQDFTPALADAFQVDVQKGALVTRVTPHSAAEAAGLRTADVIIDINGEAAQNAAQLKSVVGTSRVNASLQMKVVRGKTHLTLHARTRPFNPHKKQVNAFSHPLAGLHLMTYDQTDMQAKPVRGAQILGLSEHSLGWFGGLRAGDIITQVNDIPITDVKALIRAVARLGQAPHTLLLKIRRHEGQLFIALPPPLEDDTADATTRAQHNA